MRLGTHEQKYKIWTDGKREPHVTGYEILKYDDAQLFFMENYPCNDKYESEARERCYLENHNCVNNVRPARTTIFLYYELIKEKIQEHARAYQKHSKEQLRERKRYDETIESNQENTL